MKSKYLFYTFNYAAELSQNTVSAKFTSKQILPFSFEEQNTQMVWYDTSHTMYSVAWHSSC